MRLSIHLLLIVVGSLLGCGGEPAAPAATPATEPATPPPPVAEAKPAAGLRCGDFFTAADGAALGLDTTGYDADKTQTTPGLGVVCSIGAIGFSVFKADAYDSMMRGHARGVEQGALKAEEGPALASASTWSSMGPMTQVMFLSTSKSHAGQVTGTDKAQVEKFARALDAKLK